MTRYRVMKLDLAADRHDPSGLLTSYFISEHLAGWDVVATAWVPEGDGYLLVTLREGRAR